MRRTRGIVALLIVTLVGLGACSHKRVDQVSDDATAVLAPHVQAMRTAAANHNAAGLTAELSALRAAVNQLRAADKLSVEAANAILAQATAVEQQSALITTTTTSAPVTSRPVVIQPQGGGGKGDGHKGGGDKGGGKD